jgi:CRISPR/Cas system CSM-associated protein Csm4 (group 5 of RAMP superfamily)
VGHHSGDRERVDAIFRSDALFSALTHAMRALGWLEEWLDATARAADAPAVRFSSLFPFIGKTRLITPPKTTWPPANSGKLYLSGIKLAPLEIARGGAIDESRWTPDGASECLIPSGSHPPFHVSVRSAAAVDRLTGAVEPHRVACLEFASNAGLWGVFDAGGPMWESRMKSAFRLLADSGFGGERSRGWGRASEPQFSTGSALFPPAASNGSWWLLSLYSPHEADPIDWSKGQYTAVVRGGWTDSPAGSGAKKSVRMIEEGSVLDAQSIRGRAVDVAPDGFAHPVYRWGIALSVPAGPAPAQPEEPAPELEPQPAPIEGGTGGSARPDSEPETSPEPAAPETEAQPETSPEPESSEAQPEPEISPEPETSPESETSPEPTAPETEAQPETSAESESSEAQPEPEPSPEPETPPEPQPQPAPPEEPES